MHLFARKTGEGYPLIILHALYGMSDNWLTIGKSLGRQGFAVHLPDIRNHGRSPHRPSHSYPDMCDDLFAYLKGDGVKKAAIIGHSMGGKMAMWFSLLYPKMVEKLAVIDIAPSASGSTALADHTEIISQLMAIDLARHHSRQTIVVELERRLKDRTLAHFFGKSLMRDGEGQFQWRLNLAVLLNSLPAIFAGLDELDSYAPSPVETLFVRGATSDYIQPKHKADVIKYFPHSTIITVENAGHWLQMDQPEKLLEILLGFLPVK